MSSRTICLLAVVLLLQLAAIAKAAPYVSGDNIFHDDDLPQAGKIKGIQGEMQMLHKKMEIARAQEARLSNQFMTQAKFSGAASRIKPTDTRCVLCQYMVQRVKAEMLVNGIGGGVPFSSAGGRPMVGVEKGDAPYSTVPDVFTAPAPGNNLANHYRDDLHASIAGIPGVHTPVNSQVNQATQPLRQMAGEALLETGSKTTMKSKSRRGAPFARALGAGSPVNQIGQFLNGPLLNRNGRERQMDMLVFRPFQGRYQGVYDGPMRSAKRAQDRFENNQMYSVVFRTLEDICTQKMPKPFYPYCGAVMSEYQKIVSGLKWKDRPDAICVELRLCDENSYVQQGPHSAV